MKNSRYRQLLTPLDKLDISFTKNRGKILQFAVNYSALINGRWRYVMRVDNCHDGVAHRHVYHLHKGPLRIVLGRDNNVIFTESKKQIIKNFQKIKENYLNVRPRT